MLVKLTTSRVLDNGQTQDHGDVVEMSPVEAKAVIAAGQGIEWTGPETAMREPKRERAVRPAATAKA